MKMNKVLAIVLVIVFCSMAVFAIAGGKTNSITGTVTDSTSGAAISGATVSNGTISTTTNSHGVYTLSNVKAGINTVTASAPGYTTVSHPVTAPKSGSVTLDFSLTAVGANGTISGTVTDAVTTMPISGATVKAGSTTATTIANGSYSMSIAPGSYPVTAAKTGYITGGQAVTVVSNQTSTTNFSLTPTVASNYRVIAWNDLGMHCACPTFSGFLLLPPFNTVRAQVFDVSGRDPIFLDEATRASLGMTISYNMLENNDANLIPDVYFSQWIANAPKLFPDYLGYYPPIDPIDGRVQSPLTKAKLSGDMAYDSNLLDWIAVGIPAYPITTGDPNKDVMTDPLGGPNRDPYLTTNVTVKNSSNQVVAETTTVVPVAFGGCCTCHLSLAAANGYPSTPQGSFQYIGFLHGQIPGSKVDFNYLDPDGDGVGGPIRCSWCHLDPAMGETVPPGVPSGYHILPGAGFTSNDVHVSTRTFSDVLHTHHVQSALVISTYDSLIATDCYACHPGNNVNCYRGAHKTKTAIWCTDCHGDLIQRVNTGQLTQPWQTATLPSCTSAAKNITPNPAFACHSTSTVGGTTYPTTPGLFGAFINSRGHKGSVKCQTCHGSAHAEAPSAMALDNVQLSTVQGSVVGATYPTGKDSTYALGVCNYCHPGKTTTWGVPPHQ